MSHSAEYVWRQRQAARREQHLSRIREVTRQFVERYEGVLEEVRAAGLNVVVPVEFAAIERRVAELRRLLSTDPERAREVSMSTGRDVHALPHLARSAKLHSDAVAATRRKSLEQEVETLLDRTFASIADPVVRDFAYTAASGLHETVVARISSGSPLEQFRTELLDRARELVASAEVSAIEWKAAQATAQRGAVRADVLAHVKTIAMSGATEIAAASHARLDTAMDAVGIDDTAGFDAQLAGELNRADEIVIDEEARRAAVRAVYESLQHAGFAVAAPYLEDGAGENVVISARKPSGGEAEFRIGAAGGMLCKFDHYEGATCKVDINQVMPMLEQIYGISLSNERILWENPDRLSRDARPLDDNEAKR